MTAQVSFAATKHTHGTTVEPASLAEEKGMRWLLPAQEVRGVPVV